MVTRNLLLSAIAFRAGSYRSLALQRLPAANRAPHCSITWKLMKDGIGLPQGLELLKEFKVGKKIESGKDGGDDGGMLSEG